MPGQKADGVGLEDWFEFIDLDDLETPAPVMVPSGAVWTSTATKNVQKAVDEFKQEPMQAVGLIQPEIKVKMTFPITASYGKTVNLGDFNFARFTTSVTAVCHDGKSAQSIASSLDKFAQAFAEREVAAATSEDPVPVLPMPQLDGILYFVIGLEVGFTVNLGNYESVRLDGGASIPCAATPEAVSKATEAISGEVSKRMQANYAKFQKE